MLDYIILGFLLHGDMTGYDIKQFMQISIANFYDASFGSIYPALKKLEDGGFVTCREAVEGGKFRKVYTVTQAGRESFLLWLDEPIEMRHDMLPPLVKIFFYDRLPRERAKELLGALAGSLRGELEALGKLEGGLPCHAACFETATLDYGKSFYAFALDWCQRLIGKVDNFIRITE